jgi:lambda family phage holin
MKDFLDSISALLELLSIPFKAALLAGVLTVLRFAYSEDSRKWQRKLVELCLCVCTTYGIGAGLQSIGIGPDAAYILAVVVGWEGADYVRERAKKILEKKTGTDNES